MILRYYDKSFSRSGGNDIAKLIAKRPFFRWRWPNWLRHRPVESRMGVRVPSATCFMGQYNGRYSSTWKSVGVISRRSRVQIPLLSPFSPRRRVEVTHQAHILVTLVRIQPPQMVGFNGKSIPRIIPGRPWNGRGKPKLPTFHGAVGLRAKQKLFNSFRNPKPLHFYGDGARKSKEAIPFSHSSLPPFSAIPTKYKRPIHRAVSLYKGMGNVKATT